MIADVPRRAARWALWAGLVALSGCAAGAPAGGVDRSGAEFGAAAAALCRALEQMEADPTSAVDAFENDAHDGLHALAAAPGLGRSSAARLLEAKAQVEGAISDDTPSPELRQGLVELVEATELALTELGLDPPACEAGG